MRPASLHVKQGKLQAPWYKRAVMPWRSSVIVLNRPGHAGEPSLMHVGVCIADTS
jgi:hypothetical protein